jgi:exopolysaccharide biosynthesis polyprenyl glycosylphosphotransferase
MITGSGQPDAAAITADQALASGLPEVPFAAPLLELPALAHATLPAARPIDQRGRILRRLLLAADVTALCGALLVAELALGQFRSVDVVALLLGIPLWILVCHGHRLYHLESHRADYRAADELGPVLQMATLWSWGTLLLVLAINPHAGVAQKIALFWAVTVVLMMTLRSVVRAFARRRPWYVQQALVIGPRSQAAAIVQKIERHPEWGIEAFACAAVPRSERASARFVREGDIDTPTTDTDLIELARSIGADRVMLAPALSQSHARADLICGLSELGVHVDLIPSWSDVVGARLDLHEMEGMPLLTIPRTRLRRSAFRLKRALDLAAGTLALVVLALPMLACAIAIKLDSRGPVFFRQRRVGRDDRPFELFKFRSMCDDADDRKDDVAQLNLHGGGNDSGMFKIREDPRVTRVGAFLRRYSLDELPQLLNVLRGDMSFVGPRPLIEDEDRQVEGRFRKRLGLTPGLTGPWQVHGRSEIPFEEMVSLDYLYVTNWSLSGDVKLLMRTLPAVLRGSGAY